MENIIEIGDTVELLGSKYLVVATQIVGDVVIPLAVKTIHGGTVNSYTHRDSGGSWAAHPWKIIKKGTTTTVDKKAAIIAKVLYLDKKFKDKQARKAATTLDPTSINTTIQYYSSWAVEPIEPTLAIREQLRAYISRPTW